MTSPVVRDGLIFSSVQSYGDDTRRLKSALLEWLDTNQDGSLSREEVPKEFWERFDQSDKDKDQAWQAPNWIQPFNQRTIWSVEGQRSRQYEVVAWAM